MSARMEYAYGCIHVYKKLYWDGFTIAVAIHIRNLFRVKERVVNL